MNVSYMILSLVVIMPAIPALAYVVYKYDL